MSTYDPRLSHFDLDMARGSQGELFVKDLQRMLAEKTGQIEVKTDAWFVHTNRLYIERECLHRDGVWRKSGIDVTKAKLWAFVLGKHPGALIFETEWIRRAMVISASDSPKNLEAKCTYGQNPTRGVYVYVSQIIRARELGLDENKSRDSVSAG